MDNKIPAFENNSNLHRMMKRSGSLYIPLIGAISQLPFLPGALLGAFIIQSNAALSAEQFIQSGYFTLAVIVLGFVVSVLVITLVSNSASERLGYWAKNGVMEYDPAEEILAWGQITALPWRFGVATIAIVFLLEIAPVSLYQYFIMKIPSDQVIYSFFGGLVPGVAAIVLAILFLERFLIPAREILLPATFENQIKGSSSAYIFSKFLLVGVSLIVITTLLIGPIGYHQTYKAVYESLGSLQLFNEMRSQLIIASVLAIIIGLGLTLMLSRSLTNPINALIQTIARVEEGNLSERARVLSTDEIGELTIYFNRMISRLQELEQTMEKRVADRTEQLRVSNEVGRIATTILDPETVINRVVELITGSFDYYYAAIFLVDESNRWAELKAATGAAGKILLERHHQLQINKTSMVGNAITTRDAQVALDVGEAPVRFNNPLLPDTRSEIAIPLSVGDRVIGALDVQSIRGDDFNPEIISTLQSMANQVAIAIENARLFKEMDQALAELRQINQQYITSAWSEKIKNNSYSYTAQSSTAEPSKDTKELEINLNLRDQSIGKIRLETEGEWTPEDQTWVESLATQVAVSLENARLVDESQQSAFRERLSASIVQKIWSTNSIEGILQTAVRELGRAFDASEATITLKLEE